MLQTILPLLVKLRGEKRVLTPKGLKGQGLQNHHHFLGIQGCRCAAGSRAIGSQPSRYPSRRGHAAQELQAEDNVFARGRYNVV